MNVDEAIIAKMAWKDDGMRAYAKALLEAALRLHIRGVHFFNNDDVGPMHQPGDRTTVGAVVFSLRAARTLRADLAQVRKSP